MTPPTPVQLYSAALVLPISAPPVRDGAVAVRNGHISHVGTRAWVLSSLEQDGAPYTEYHWPGLLTPGLVNAHTHLQYTGMCAVAQRQYHEFEEWASAFNGVYDSLRGTWYQAARAGADQLLRAGTTAAADVVTDQEAFGALHDAGLHGIEYWEVIDWSNHDWAAHGRATTAQQLADLPDLITTGLSPHAPYSLEILPLLDLPDIARANGHRLHIHLGESRIEREGPGADQWPRNPVESFREVRRHGIGVSSTQFVDTLGVLGPDCHIAHGVYLNARDREILRIRGTSVALCPRSNAIIGLDEAPVAAYLEEGNPIAIGTDSLSSSPSLDVLDDLAVLCRIARDQGYDRPDLHARLLSAATMGGAAALGRTTGRDRIGHLQVGALADIACFDIPVTTTDETIARLVEHGAGTAQATIVAGALKWHGPGWEFADAQPAD